MKSLTLVLVLIHLVLGFLLGCLLARVSGCEKPTSISATWDGEYWYEGPDRYAIFNYDGAKRRYEKACIEVDEANKDVDDEVDEDEELRLQEAITELKAAYDELEEISQKVRNSRR